MSESSYHFLFLYLVHVTMTTMKVLNILYLHKNLFGYLSRNIF